MLAQHFRHVEQLFDGIHSEDTGAAESGVEHFIAAGERTGVRSSGFRSGFGVADFDDDDGFRKRDFARGGEK